MLKIVYLNAGSLFMLKTKLASGRATIFLMLVGLARTRVLPRGILMLAAHFCKNSMDPNEVSILEDSGLSALPLKLRMV